MLKSMRWWRVSRSETPGGFMGQEVLLGMGIVDLMLGGEGRQRRQIAGKLWA